MQTSSVLSNIFLVWSTLFFTCTTPERCFSENETISQMLYANTRNPIPNKVRIHSGAWDSQSTCNFVAYILLKEKFGMDVEFFPPLPNNSENLRFSQGFDHEWGHNKLYHLGHPTVANYWNDYDWWCEQNKVHIFGELSSFHHTGPGSAVHLLGAPNGVISKSGFFMPNWMDNHYGGKDWKNIFRNKTLQQLSYSPAHNKSIVWGSFAYYQLSQTAEALLEYHNLTDIWHIEYLGGDVLLLDKVQELVDAKQDFVFLSWTPGIVTANGMFTPIVWPYNPSGLQRDPCVLEGSCDYADDIAALGICAQWEGNDKISHHFVSAFLQNLDLTRTIVNSMMEGYSQGGGLYESVCTWLQTPHNREIWEAWISDVPLLNEPRELEFSEVGKIGIYVSSTLLSTVFLCAAGTLMWLQHVSPELVARLNVTWTTIWILILTVLAISPIILVQDVVHQSCSVFYAINLLCISFAMLVPAVKNWRIAAWFQKGEVYAVPNWQIYSIKAVVFIIDWALIIPQIYYWETEGSKEVWYGENSDLPEYESTCESDEWLWRALTNIWLFILVCFMLYCAYISRNAWQKYNESQWLAGSAVFTFLIGLASWGLESENEMRFLMWRQLYIPLLYFLVIGLFGSFWVTSCFKGCQDKEIAEGNLSLMEERVDDIVAIMNTLDKPGMDMLKKRLKTMKIYDSMHFIENSMLEMSHLNEELLIDRQSYRESVRFSHSSNRGVGLLSKEEITALQAQSRTDAGEGEDDSDHIPGLAVGSTLSDAYNLVESHTEDAEVVRSKQFTIPPCISTISYLKIH